MKRAAPPRMHAAFERAMRSASRESAVELSSRIDARHVLGVSTRPHTCARQAEEAKQLHPDAIVLLRVGDFYEAFGCDAVVVADTTDVHTLAKVDVKASVRCERIQRALNALLARGWCAALYEETRVVATPRQRIFCQYVSMAAPVYAHAREADDAPGAKPIVAIAPAEHASWDVAMCMVAQRAVRVHRQIGEALAESIVSQSDDPILCVRAVPSFVKACAAAGVVVAGGGSFVSDRLLAHVEETHRIPREEFQVVAARADGGCAPPPRFTLLQLGIGGDHRASGDTPSLADACVTPKATALVRHQVARWLSHPPPHACAIRQCVLALMARVESLPPLRPARGGRWRHAVKTLQADALRDVHANLVAFERLARDTREDADVGPGVARGVAADLGLAFDELRFSAALARMDAVLDREHGGVRESLVRDEAAALRHALGARSDALAALESTTYAMDKGHVSFHGRPDGADKLPFCDRAGRIIPHRYTTAAMRRIDGAVDAAQAELDEATTAALLRMCNDLVEFQAELEVVETWALELATLVDHVRAVGRAWAAPFRAVDGASLDVRGLFPYWLHAGVRNDVRLEPGSPVVLTGPNGGGKSTLLRAIGAVALLAQCGLLAPCESASLPEYRQIFLRAGANDCAHERRSSFASELGDLKTMLISAGPSLLLVDEACRGTSTVEGVRLFGAILEHLPATFTSIFTTHYHQELQTDACEWRQLAMCVDDATGSCTPDFRILPGKCEDSMSLRVALAVGLPLDIVDAARRDADDVILVLAVLRRLGLRYTALQDPMRETPPPSVRSALYVLFTTLGVYVGESDRLDARLRAHARTKTIRSAVVVAAPSKTEALRLETLVQNELRHCDVVLLSIADAAHEVR